MKVKELIEELQRMNPESEVFLQKDPEGNGFESLSGSVEGWMVDGAEMFLDVGNDEEYGVNPEDIKGRVLDVLLYP